MINAGSVSHRTMAAAARRKAAAAARRKARRLESSEVLAEAALAEALAEAALAEVLAEAVLEKAVLAEVVRAKNHAMSGHRISEEDRVTSAWTILAIIAMLLTDGKEVRHEQSTSTL